MVRRRSSEGTTPELLGAKPPARCIVYARCPSRLGKSSRSRRGTMTLTTISQPLTWLPPPIAHRFACNEPWLQTSSGLVAEVAARVSAISHQDEAPFANTHWLNMLRH